MESTLEMADLHQKHHQAVSVYQNYMYRTSELARGPLLNKLLGFVVKYALKSYKYLRKSILNLLSTLISIFKQNYYFSCFN